MMAISSKAPTLIANIRPTFRERPFMVLGERYTLLIIAACLIEVKFGYKSVARDGWVAV